MNDNDVIFSDDDVVRSVREGNTRNFEILIDRYKRKIVNFIHKMIFDYDESQSLAQDVFLKVYETIRKYKTENNFQAFIFTIAKNMTLNHIKKQKRVLFFSGMLTPRQEDKHFQSEGDQHSRIEQAQQQAMINAALKQLNENQRLALIMKIYMEFSYNKIAEITGWSIPKIETLISRARSNLKERVQAEMRQNEQHSRSPVNRKMQEKRPPNVLNARAI